MSSALYRHISAGSHLIMSRMREQMAACHRNEELLYKLIAAQPDDLHTRKKCIEVALNEHAMPKPAFWNWMSRSLKPAPAEQAGTAMRWDTCCDMCSSS
jgi:hypothetical protein